MQYPDVQGDYRGVLQADKMALGKSIAARREALGWSQNELAKRSGLNSPTLNRIESGKSEDPSLSLVTQIARALGTTVEALLGSREPDLIVEMDDGAVWVVQMKMVKPSGAAADDLRASGLIQIVSAIRTLAASVRWEGLEDVTPLDGADATPPARPPSLAEVWGAVEDLKTAVAALQEESRRARAPAEGAPKPKPGQQRSA